MPVEPLKIQPIQSHTVDPNLKPCVKPEAKSETWNVSAYCPCRICCGKWAGDGQTASGHKIKPGDRFIAAPRSIPFGTWITVPGYGRAQVLDRGGAIREGCLDLFFDTHQEALEWGRKHIAVKIIEKKWN